MPELKCTITENDKLLKSVTQTMDFERFLETVAKFETEINAVLTELINGIGDVGGDGHVDDECDDSDDQDLNEEFSPKKKKED